MKFRIMEKRGKFRIEKCERIIKYDKPLRFGKWAKYTETQLKWGDWEIECNLDKLVTKFSPLFGGEVQVHPRTEFDTYKQAENYIKKHYGLDGVKAIEEPEWRQV